MTAPTRNTDRLFFDLSPRVKLRVTGADRIRFLNGQITNDIRKASETRAIEACVLNAKGKMEAHLFVHPQGDSFLIDADPALGSVLQARLERYVIADDVQIEDITGQFSIFHLLGSADTAIFPVRFGSSPATDSVFPDTTFGAKRINTIKLPMSWQGISIIVTKIARNSCDSNKGSRGGAAN